MIRTAATPLTPLTEEQHTKALTRALADTSLTAPLHMAAVLGMPVLDQPDPYFPHDCEECVYLGHFTPEAGNGFLPKPCDLYVCPHDSWGLTYIARRGLDGDYLSSSEPSPRMGSEYPLNEAARRWATRSDFDVTRLPVGTPSGRVGANPFVVGTPSE